MNHFENEFEHQLIDSLTSGEVSELLPGQDVDFNKVFRSRLWEYRPDIKTTTQLEKNFKEILERNNQEKLDGPLSQGEFRQVLDQIYALNTPYQAGKFLYGLNGRSEVEVNLEDGRHVFLKVFDQSQVGAGDTVYQVVNQIERPAVIPGNPDRRFDVTLLINGLPIYQIELKKDTVDVEEALNQIEQYARENQFSGIFSTVQIFVAMTPYNAKYMAAVKGENFNKDFSFNWKDEKNRNVRDWKYVANHFLTIPAAHLLATNYMILDGTAGKESIKVMRPYQVTATRRAIENVKNTDFSGGYEKDGYIWHTTGSGKTITSFKTAQLASKLPNVDKVVFLVDRKSLTKQTLESYQGYDPERDLTNSSEEFGMIKDTANTNTLSRRIKENKSDIIITSTQKMRKLIQRSGFKAPNKNILFIVDEAHRSTGSDTFRDIQKAFPKSAWIGYSGTPVFDDNKKGSRTVDIFGNLIHDYTIRHAIADKNVLGFKVDFNATVPEEEQLQQLKDYYKELHPSWSEKEINDKVKNLTPEDMDDSIRGSFYDNNPAHIKAVVKDIVENWENRSVNWKYNAVLTTHVGGNKPSVPMALMYYEEFQRQNEIRKKHRLRTLNVAISVNADESNSDKMNTVNVGLKKAIKDYDDLFGTEFLSGYKYGIEAVDAYNSDLEDRLSKRSGDGKYLDLVIVVDRLLTGFDAPELNTLYVDRTLRGANLIQAYSRTNRIHDNQDKPFGNIVTYRWPKYSEQLMNDALSVYSNEENANLTPSDKKKRNIDYGILAGSFQKQIEETRKIIDKIRELTEDCEHIPTDPGKQDRLLEALKKYSQQISKLKQYPLTEDGKEGFDYKHPEDLLEKIGITELENVTITVTLTNELKREIGKRLHIPPHMVDLRVEHLKQVMIDYEFLTELIQALMDLVHENKMEEAKETHQRIMTYMDGVEDRNYARQVNEASEAILNRSYPTEESGLKFPYKFDGSNMLMKNIQSAQKAYLDKLMNTFRHKWGLLEVITNDQLRAIIANHEFKNDDLNPEGMKDLLREAAKNYKDQSNDPEIRDFSKLKYRDSLKQAILELADSQVRE